MGFEVGSLRFDIGSVGDKVIVAFIGDFSTISEDVIFSLNQILDRISMSQFNFSSRFSSFIDLNDLKTSPTQSFKELLSKAPTKTGFKDKKLLDFLLRGFTLNTKLTGDFDESSIQELLNAFVVKFVPGYIKSIINNIIKFKNPKASVEKIGEILAPVNVADKDRVTQVFIDNITEQLTMKLADDPTHFADIFDLSDIVGAQMSDFMNLGGVFFSHFVKGLLGQLSDELEVGVFKLNCHIELGVKSNGLIEFLNALYSRMG